MIEMKMMFVRYHCHITKNCRGSANRDCNTNVQLNHKIPVLHDLKDYHSYHIMQELGKINLQINVKSNGLERYKSFSINNKLSFINTFQLLRFSLDSLVRNLNKDDLILFVSVIS